MRELRRLLGYARPYRGRLTLAFLAMALVSALSALSIGALQPLFDLLFSPPGAPVLSQKLPKGLRAILEPWLAQWQVPGARKLTMMTGLCSFILLAFVVKGVASYAHHYLMNFVSEGIAADVRERLYAHLHRLSLRFFSEKSTGETMARFTFDADALGKTVEVLFNNGVKELLLILGLMGLLIALKWQLALLSLVVLPVGIFPVVKFGQKVRVRSHRVQERWAELSGILQETLSGIRIVKAFGAEAYEQARFAAKNREIFRGILRIVRVDGLISPLLEILGAVGVVGAVWLGGYMVIRGYLSPGQLTVFLFALASLYQPIRRVGQIHTHLQRTMAGVTRVLEILDTEPDLVEAPGAPALPRMQEGIAFRDVAFAYPTARARQVGPVPRTGRGAIGDRALHGMAGAPDGDAGGGADDRSGGEPILHGITFQAKLNEMVAIVGSSGVGKTTLVNLIPRFYDPTGGCIEIDGVDIRGVTLRSLRDQMGIVTQETILFDDTVYGNIAYGRRDVTPDMVHRAAEAADALEFIERLPEGFETRVGERGVRLSGGQRQRIALARAILRDPPILILDEATSALDAESERAVQVALEGLMARRTTFVIAHRLSTVMRADRIIVLEGGTIAEMGTHVELLARRGAYHRLYQHQFQEVGP